MAQDRLAWYKFNETSGTTAANTSSSAGNATLGTSTATPTWNSGSLSFDGVDDFVQTPVTNGTARTLAAWIYPKSSDYVGEALIESVFDCDVPGNYGTGWGLNNLFIYVILDDTVWNSGVMITRNQWQHVCVTYDSTKVRVYLNGVLKGSRTYTQGAVTTTATYKIGRSNANALFFHGDIKDAKIYSRLVTDQEVLTIQSSESAVPAVAPSGLTALAGAASVGLRWQSANAGETWYRVSRSTSPGGPYTDLATTVVGSSYVDANLTNGTTYYYVIAASNLQGTGPNSSEISATPMTGTSYYIDPTGNDSNPGTSEASPWKSIAKVNATTFKPGDQVLFKRGGSWAGTVSPQGSGNSAAQITLSSYGVGAKPYIDGAGAGAGIAISGQSYWTIDGFEVTNQAGGAGGARCGIRVGGGGDGSTIRKIRILNNDVHDVQATPNVNDGARNWGGIFVWIDEPGKADDVLIQGNTVTEIQGQGISFWGEYDNVYSDYTSMNYNNCSPNVVARGNRVWRTSGDGLLLLGTDNELAEFNEVAYAGVLSSNGNAIAAAWPTRHRDGVWQYNHVHHTKWLEANDSTAFDQDGYVFGTTYFQYNYTHHNEGGFNMEYYWTWDYGQTVSRYNLSVSDGRNGNYARVYFSNRAGSMIYNNVFYNPGMQLDVSNGGANTTYFYNNIFVGSSRTTSFDSQGVFYNNHFFGGMTATDTANGNKTQDPKFVDPNLVHNLTGFILQSSSPCINAGQLMSSNGGKDFWGTTLPATAPHRGMSQLTSSSGYTATPSFVHVSGPFSVVVPFNASSAATFTANVHDQNFRPMTSPPVTWELSPTVAGCSVDANGSVTLSPAVVGQRFAVTATSGTASHTFSFSTTPAVWTNSATTGIWNTTDANWSGQTWSDGGEAVFSHTADAQTVTVSGNRSVTSLKIGNGSNNANYTLTGASGASISATDFTLQGSGNNNPGLGAANLNHLNLSTTADLRVGRWDLIISGNSEVNIGGQLRSTSDGNGSGDWGRVTIQDSANVTATGGVSSSGSVWGLTLNGGTLTTPSIRAAENSYSAGSRLTFNGTKVVASQDNANFVTVDSTNQAYVGTSGAIFDTNGHDIGIGVSLQGSGGLTKLGSGTLSLNGSSFHTGNTAVEAGTLRLASAGLASTSTLSIASDAVLDLAFSGNAVVRELFIHGIQQPRGIWSASRDASHFAGSGSLSVTEGPDSDTDGIWTNPSAGNWSDQANWQNTLIARGTDFTATFNQNIGSTITVDAGRTIGNLLFANANFMLTGEALTLASSSGTSSVTVDIGCTAVVTTPLTGNVNLQKSGDGTLALGAANTYSGNTIIAAGTLRVMADTTAGISIANAGFETPSFGDSGWSYAPSETSWSIGSGGVARNGSPWVSSAPEGVQAGFIQNSGSLSQTLTVPTGGLYELTFKAANRPGYADSGISVQIDGITVKNYPAGTFASGGAFQAFVIRGVSLAAGSRTLTFAGSQNGPDSATAIDEVRLTGYSAGNLPAGTAVNLTGGTLHLDSAQTIASLTGSSGTNVVNQATLTVGDASNTTFIGALSGAGSLVKVGLGNLVLSGGWSYTGSTSISGGTLTSGAAAGTSIQLAALTLNGGTLAATNEGDATLGNFQLRGDVTVAGTTRSIISADVRAVNSETRNFDVASTGDASGVDLLISGKIGHHNGSAWGFASKSGPGTMLISGVNELGSLTINAGKVVLENTGLGGFWNGGLVNHSQAELRVTGTNSTSLTQSISGSGAVTKSGSGTLELTAVSSYTGGTTVNEGKLVLATGNAGGTGCIRGALTLQPGAMVETTGDGTGLGWVDQISSVAISGGTLSSAGIIHVWNIPGGITMTGGTLQSNNGTSDPNGPQLEWNRTAVTTQASEQPATIAGRIRMRNDHEFSGISFTVADGTAATDLLVSAAITEATSGMVITKSGSGTMVLSGNNNYSGATTISAGSLIADPTGTLGLGNLGLADGAVCSLRNSTGAIADAATVSLIGTARLDLADGVTETVSKLTIDGALVKSGIWNAARDPLHFSGTGNLVVTDGLALTPGESWREIHFGTLENSGDAADSADPDADGFENLLERAFGMNPRGNDATRKPEIDSTNQSNSIFSITYTKSRAATDVALVVQSSSDLSATSWNDVSQPADGTIHLIDDAQPDVQVFRFTTTNSANHHFYRIAARSAP